MVVVEVVVAAAVAVAAAAVAVVAEAVAEVVAGQVVWVLVPGLVVAVAAADRLLKTLRILSFYKTGPTRKCPLSVRKLYSELLSKPVLRCFVSFSF